MKSLEKVLVERLDDSIDRLNQACVFKVLGARETLTYRYELGKIDAYRDVLQMFGYNVDFTATHGDTLPKILSRKVEANKIFTVVCNESTAVEEALLYIQEFFEQSYGYLEAEQRVITDISDIHLLTTGPEDDQYEIRVNADLKKYRLRTYIDGICVRTEKWKNLADMIEECLKKLNWKDLTSISYEEIEMSEKANEILNTPHIHINEDIKQEEGADNE